MAGVRLKVLLVVLAWILRLVLVQEWEPIDEYKLYKYYETGEWTEPGSLTSPDDTDDDDDDDGDDYDDGDYSDTEEDVDSEVEGIASVFFDPADPNGFQIDEEESVQKNLVGRTEDGHHAKFAGALPKKWSSGTDQIADLDVVCTDSGFEITFLTCPWSEIKVFGSNDYLPVTDALASCGYEVNTMKNTLKIPFTGCLVTNLTTCNATTYMLQLLYSDKTGRSKVATVRCEEETDLGPRAAGSPTTCIHPTKTTATTPTTPHWPNNCPVSPIEWMPCGSPGISEADCRALGCCMKASTCYHPVDECTADQHFVFAIRHDSASIPVDPTKLVVPGRPHCKPILVNDKVAIFKFKVTECGSRSYEVGETKIYLAEVQTIVEVLNLKYGVITRNNPMRFLVECRYGKLASVQQGLSSVGFLVKIPSSSLPAAVFGEGMYGVELRIAKDETYSCFYHTNSMPLRKVLGTKVYLELNLLSPTPEATIRVRYCIAFPRSARNVLVLIHEGCTNPNDPNVYILLMNDLPTNRHQRRIAVSVFEFMIQVSNKFLDEDIIFMCSTEVCIPREKQCDERCFDRTTF